MELQSPLARLYGKDSRGRDRKRDVQGRDDEMEELKEEVGEMRESQRRVEEMLSKVLAGAGAGGGK
jgi:HAMP domain-containing protein